jgi:hypothetical protein
MTFLACTSSERPASGDGATDSEPTIRFATHVFPVLERVGCGECHTTERRVTSHWSLGPPDDTYRQWVNSRGFDHCGPAGAAIEAPQPDHVRVIPGDPDGSLVIKKLTDPWEMCGLFYGHMPPSPRLRLTTEDLALVRAWIVAGAPP